MKPDLPEAAADVETAWYLLEPAERPRGWKSRPIRAGRR